MSTRSQATKARWERLGAGAIASSKSRECRRCTTKFVIKYGNQRYCHGCLEQCYDTDGSLDNVKVMRLYSYNLVPSEFDALWEAQQGRCKICEEPMSFGKRGKTCLHVDHDHTTNRVRGLLCRSCNMTLGFIEREIGWLDKALAYLKEHKT